MIGTACQQETRQAITPVGDSAAAAKFNAAHPAITRQGLIRALKEVGQWASSRDSTQVARMYRWPVPDSTLPVFFNDSVFDAKKQSNGNLISESMFYYNYDRISAGLWLEDLKGLYNYLDVNQLQKMDNLAYSEKNPKEACVNFCSVQVTGDTLVQLTFGVNTNPEYKGKDAKDVECGEHTIVWTFVFDGKKLWLVKEWVCC